MNSSIYGRLAFTNLKNNRKTYVPYVLTAILTVMMSYMMSALARNSSVGDGSIQLCLYYAEKVLTLFAVIFLFYTNSFLIKRRKKEIGVYNILGMGKGHISKMMLIETGFIAAVSIAAGIIMGILFSKLMYLVLLKLLDYDIRMEFEISPEALGETLILFLVIFAMTLVYDLMQIRIANPIELLYGSSQGEKEPKTKKLLTAFGIIAIGIGYYIALTTESPLTALTMFFLAVVCVILGTYALFVAGSIAFLKALKKNKKFYYQAKHFTSVSGMIYRMKQNAVGLANICILSTMVLIMISTTVSLYVGEDDVLKARFPHEFSINSQKNTVETETKINEIVDEEVEAAGVRIKDELFYHYGALSAWRDQESFTFDSSGKFNVADILEFYMLPQEDYKRMEGDNTELADDEVIVYTTDTEPYGGDKMQIGGKTFRVVKELKDMKIEPKNHSRITAAYYVVFSGEEQIEELLTAAFSESSAQEEWKVYLDQIHYKRFFDLEGDQKTCEKVMENIQTRLQAEVPDVNIESRELNREIFCMLYGCLFFIGLYLGSMFLIAMVLIIYYKQISEGYDDRERYQIMQQVGMDKREVKRSIRSQVLLVFFLPLFAAVLHVAVAFKVVTRLLAILGLFNVPLFLLCTIVTVAIFAVFYVIVFVLTEREYYRIVN